MISGLKVRLSVVFDEKNQTRASRFEGRVAHKGLTEACVHEDLRNIFCKKLILKKGTTETRWNSKGHWEEKLLSKAKFSYRSLDCSLMQSLVQNPREKRWNKKSWISLSLSLSHTHTHTRTHTERHGGMGSGTLEFMNRMQVKELKSLSSLNKHLYWS